MPVSSEPILLYSIQSWYNVYVASRNGKSILSCDEVIKIPVAKVINEASYNIIPCVAIRFPDEITDASDIIEIETNEGITVTSFQFSKGYGRGNYLLVLPPKTTCVKSAKLRLVVKGVTIYSDLMFDVMLPPYDYENALLTPVWGDIEYFNSRIRDLSNRITDLEDATPHYGYATQKAGHTIDFSRLDDAFTIAPDTRFLTFTVTNPLERATSMHILLTSEIDASNSVMSTCMISPGNNKVKVDLQVLAIFIQNDTDNTGDSYIMPPMEDRRYEGIRFSHKRNTNLPGDVQVTEWA